MAGRSHGRACKGDHAYGVAEVLEILQEQRGGRERQRDDEHLTCTSSGLEVFDRSSRLKEKEMGESEGRGLILGVLWT